MKYTQTDRIFIDSNLWIYLSITDKESTKHLKAILFFETHVDKDINISVQVINEYHWVLLRKYKLSEPEIEEKVNKGILQLSNVLPLRLETYNTSKYIREKYKVSFWDSLIISSALLNNCSILYSEDMHNGLIIENILKIINPFEDDLKIEHPL